MHSSTFVQDDWDIHTTCTLNNQGHCTYTFCVYVYKPFFIQSKHPQTSYEALCQMNGPIVLSLFNNSWNKSKHAN